MNYQVLAAELALPAYAGLTDQEAADALNARTVSVDVETISGADLLDATTPADLTALSAAQRNFFNAMLAIPNMIVRGANTRAHLAAMFGPGTQTRTNLSALQQTTTSRSEQLGLPRIGAHHVAMARSML